LLLDVSLWSANLVNMEADVQSILPFADAFHLDIADGHFTPTLLFFPDLVCGHSAQHKQAFARSFDGE
jgi:ribulose-phosphate 3-epimerase